MRFLVVSDFEPNGDSGAAGTLMALGRELEALGHAVSFQWKVSDKRHIKSSYNFSLGSRQLKRVGAFLRTNGADVVIISQPYAYRVFEELPRRYPGTLFLNRTHGWEARLYEVASRFQWHEPRTMLRRGLSELSGALHRRACRRTIEAAHGVLVPGGPCADFMRRTYPRCASKVHLVPYGIDADWTAPVASVERPSGPLRAIFAGNYLRRKGSGVLKEATERLGGDARRLELTLVVAQNDLRTAESDFANYPGKLALMPWMRREALGALFSQQDILLHPSLFEGFGKVWLEALACGLPVIGFREGGLADTAKDCSAVMAHDTGDIEGFANSLRQAVQNPGGVRSMRILARSAAIGRSWRDVALDTEALCRRLLQRLGNGGGSA